MKTAAIFFPFDLFGSAGAANGAQLLADAFREMLADNRRERLPTRAVAYQDKVRLRELPFETLPDYQNWHRRARQAIRQANRQGEFLLWITGNHLGALPVYEELGADTLVIQLDAHLDIYNLTDCTAELSHGNFLLHADGPLPRIINVGHRELLLRPEYVKQYYQATFPTAELAVGPTPALHRLRSACKKAKRVFLDIDCDVFDAAYFPAVAHPVPFGLSPSFLFLLLDAIWSDRLVGMAISEFDPGRDRNDQGLATLVWLLEFLLLKRHEASQSSIVNKKAVSEALRRQT